MPDSAMSRSLCIRLENVGVRIGNAMLLSNCSLQLNAGERLVILGANGAGKSTLLKLIHRLIAPTTGVLNVPDVQSQSLIFQRPVLLKRSVRENIDFELRARGFSEAEIAERGSTALEQCNLVALAHRYARTLSGGEQQRVALARAFAAGPELLLADEPTASLAPAATREVEALLRALHAKAGTLVMTTHNVAQAKRIATRILFLDRGRIVEDASNADFFNAPRSTEAREYLEGETV
jgi:tungstate transport system ATP-binding protein